MSIYTCEEHNNCIVNYEGRSCPVCDIQKELSELQLEAAERTDEEKG